MNLIVDCEVVYEGGTAVSRESFDLSKQNELFAVVVGFGNGIFDEMRVTGSSKEALFHFVRLLQGGGFDHGASPLPVKRQLYQEGDACFPSAAPFVFLSPVTKSGDKIDFSELESEIQERAAELEPKLGSSPPEESKPMETRLLFSGAKEAQPWWKFW